MKNTYLITSVESRLNLSPTIQEHLADCSAKIKDAALPTTWQRVKHNSIELFTKGLVELTFLNRQSNEVINMPVPFTTHFLFTCTKGKGIGSDAVWCNSLS